MKSHAWLTLSHRTLHSFLLVAALILFSMPAAAQMSAEASPPLMENTDVDVQPVLTCEETFTQLVDEFVASPYTYGLFDSASVVLDSYVSAPDAATAKIVGKAAFVSYPPEAFNVYRIDAASIPDPAILAQAQQEYTDYVSPQVAAGDCLVNILWTTSDGRTFETLGLGSSTGSAKFEPLMDMVVVPSSGLNSRPVVRRGAPTGYDTDTWENLIGVTKAWGQVQVSALGSDGCQASFSAEFTSGAAFPFVVEPPNAEPTVVKTCFTKEDCECRQGDDTKSNKMECGQVSQSYSVIGRIGTQWFGADITSYGGVVKAWACADGQTGSGNW